MSNGRKDNRAWPALKATEKQLQGPNCSRRRLLEEDRTKLETEVCEGYRFEGVAGVTWQWEEQRTVYGWADGAEALDRHLSRPAQHQTTS